MNKYKKYISLELAKELSKIADINHFELPESEYGWTYRKLHDDWIIQNYKYLNYGNAEFSAYGIFELGEILPLYYCSFRKKNNWYRCFGGEKVVSFEADTEVEARGKMLVYLIKNNLIV